LRAWLRGPDAELRGDVIEVLARIPGRAAGRLLASRPFDDTAVAARVARGDLAAAAAEGLARSHRGEDQGLGIEALAESPDPGAHRVLAALLPDEDRQTAAACALAKRPTPEDAVAVTPHLEAEEADLRLCAALAWARAHPG
jgi:hypothetical protein